MNRNFLITGGARGIGRALSEQALRSGGRVFFTDINQEEGLVTKSELSKDYGVSNVEFFTQDVTKEEDWSVVWSQAEAFFGGKVEALVNNAGIYGGQGSLDTKILDVNLIGMVHGTKLAQEKMSVENGGHGGVIIQMGSVTSVAIMRVSNAPLYAASKHGILALVRSYGPHVQERTKIRMMALCPCLVDTPLSRGAMNVDKDAKFSSEMGMRALQASEVAEAFERLVVAGGTGEALLVYPGLTFYWPNVQYWMFNVYCYISKFLIMALGHKRSEPVEPGQLGGVLIFLAALFGYFCHVLLQYLGI